MKRTLLLALASAVALLPLAGCAGKDESFNANDIAVKQPGDGPPPMNAPMNEGGTPAQGK